MNWDDLKIFLAACEAGSFSGAARSLGVGQATVSRRIAALEQQIAHPLFDRGRGGLRPTPAAAALLPRARAIAAELRRAGAALEGLEAGPEGVVRLAAPPGVAADLLPPLLGALRRRYPKIRLEILADNLARDLDRREADVALRSVRPEGGDLVMRRLMDVPLGAFASRGYLASLPADAGPDDLEWLQWSAELAHIPMARWIAARLGERPPALTTNCFLTMRAAAAAGAGCVLFPALQARVAGLAPVPIDLGPPPVGPLYLVTHRALRQVPRVAAVIDFIVEVLDALEDIDGPWPPPGFG